MSVFMNYEGVNGESSDKGHEDWIDLTGWEWDIKRNITSATSTRGDRESANAVINDLKVTKKMDSSSNKRLWS